MIEFGRGPSENTRMSRSGWVADPLPGLTQRVRELEAQLSSMQADLDAARRRLGTYAEPDRDLNAGAVSAYHSADAIRSRARAEADEILERAADQHKLLVKEMDRLRRERDELLDDVASVRCDVASTPAALELDESRAALDLQTAVAVEMRAILAELLQQVQAQTVTPIRAAPGPSDPEHPRTEAPSEPAAPIIDQEIEELSRPELPPSRPTEEVEVQPPADTAQELVEHVDELPRQKPAEPIVDEFVEELSSPERSPWPPTSYVELEAPVETTPELVEHIEELPRPELTALIVDEYVEKLPRPVLPVALDAPLAKPSGPIIDEYVEDLRRPEYPTGPVAEPEPPAADHRIAALWDSAPLPVTDAIVPASPEEPIEQVADADPPVVVSQLEHAPFIEDEFISDPRGAALDSTEAPLPDEPSTPEEEAATQPASAPDAARASEPANGESLGVREIDVVIAPIESFLQLIEIQRRIQSLSSVEALHLGDFRNGVAAFGVSLAEAISPKEFGAAIQMLENLHLRVEGTSRNGVELRAEGDPSGAETAGGRGPAGLDFPAKYERPLKPRRRRLSIRFGRRRPREG